MKNLNYNNQDLTNYLLGSLPEDEVELFDELSFTDDEFSNALSSTEKDLIDAFVQGELNGAVLEKFQSHYLLSPARREKVNFARAFQNFAETKLNDSIEIESAEPKIKRISGGFFSRFNIFTSNKPLLQWGFASVLMFCALFGGYLIVNNLRNQKEIQIVSQDNPGETNQDLPPSPVNENLADSNTQREIAPLTNSDADNSIVVKKESKSEQKTKPETKESPKPKDSSIVPRVNIASFVLMPAMRGSNRIPSLSIAKDVTNVVMRLKLESDDYAAYQVVLTDESNNILWRGSRLKAKGDNDNKILNVSFPSKLLNSKFYSLQISGTAPGSAAEIISDYPFKIVRQ